MEYLPGCLIWLGCKDSSGYGSVRINGKMIGLHRLSYMRNYGKIPHGMHVLHKCDRRACVNPEHLFLGTNADNVKDRVTKSRNGMQPKRKSHCKRGHERTLISIDKNGTCLACRRFKYSRKKGGLDAPALMKEENNG